MQKLLTLVGVSIALFTQINFASAQTASDKAVADACNCFKGLDKKKLKTDEDKKEAATECLTDAMIKNITGLADEYGFDLADMDEEMGRKIGEKFGAKLATSCPESLPYLMSVAQDDTEENLTKMMGYEREGSSVGTLVRVETSGSDTYLVIKTADGEEKLAWIRPFPGADNLEADSKKLIGKKVSVRWGEFLKYNAQLKGYGKVREVLAFKVEG